MNFVINDFKRMSVRIARTENFKKSWAKLNVEQKNPGHKAIQNMLLALNYPAPGVKKINGTGNIWEARVNRSIRITFQISGDLILLRNIGQHDETLRNP